MWICVCMQVSSVSYFTSYFNGVLVVFSRTKIAGAAAVAGEGVAGV